VDREDSEHEQERVERLKRAMYSRTMSQNLKERPRREMDEVRPLVGEEWRHEEPKLAQTSVAPRGITFMRGAMKWLLIAAAAFFVIAIVFFIYYFTFGGGSSSASARNIEISVSGPPQIAGGEPTQLQITVTNRNQVALELADLVITYPPGTRSPADFSTDLTTERISLGTIEPGGRRQGPIRPVFSGNNPDIDIKVELEYRLSNSSAIFVATTNYRTTLSSSPLAISVESNTETISGQPVEFTVTVASNVVSEFYTPVKDVLLETTFPFGFTLAPSSGDPLAPKPILKPGGALWELGDLAQGQRKQVTFRGTLKGESGDERLFRFSAGTRQTPEGDAITTKIAESTHAMKISNAFLGLGISVNRSATSSAVVATDTTVNVAVNWQNNLSTPIQDAVIIARLSGMPIDGATVVTPEGFYRSSDGVVLWDKTTTKGALANVAAGARGSFTFTFRVPTTEMLVGIKDPTLTITVNAAGKRIAEDGVPENLQATASQRIAVESDLKVIARGLYYTSPYGATGPLPPKANTETTYAIVFRITNTTNRIEDGKLIATLPPYVRWIGMCSPRSECDPNSSDSRLKFNQLDSTVTWDVGTVEQGVGTDGTNPREVGFEIGFTPSTSQIGQEPELIQDITFTGTDSSTNKEISKDVDAVTTNIVGDPGFSATSATVVR